MHRDAIVRNHGENAGFGFRPRRTLRPISSPACSCRVGFREVFSVPLNHVCPRKNAVANAPTEPGKRRARRSQRSAGRGQGAHGTPYRRTEVPALHDLAAARQRSSRPRPLAAWSARGRMARQGSAAAQCREGCRFESAASPRACSTLRLSSSELSSWQLQPIHNREVLRFSGGFGASAWR